MTRQLNISSKGSGEVYTLVYPNNLINFCKYDFTLFLEHCTDLCRLAARTGEYNVDDVYSIRNSISGCHKYYEQNMRTIFEKIVIDCWIDYLGKQNDVGVGTLWQTFMRCRNDFERAIFTRLSEYRYNKSINEWVNLLKIQEYAQRKTEFVFGVKLTSTQEAAARANYFDLIFNVAANEMGFPIDELAYTGVYSVGRLPSSPFVLSTAAREIVRNQLQGLEYREAEYKQRKNPDLTDKTAMDAFSTVKRFIPPKYDSMTGTIIKSMVGNAPKIYVPGSFKAIIDLEIDAAIESGAFIQRCAGCDEYYIRDSEYNYDYCSKIQADGRTCLDNYQKSVNENPVRFESVNTTSEPDDDDDDFKVIYVDKAVVNEKTDALYKEMAARVNVDMTQRDFSLWYQKELRLKEQILLGEAGEKELNEFIALSRGDEFASKKNRPVYNPPKRENEETELTENGREVRKFVFEKVERPASNIADRSEFRTEKENMDAIRRLFGDSIPTPAAVAPQPQPVHQPQYTQASRPIQPAPRPVQSYATGYQPQQFIQQPIQQPVQQGVQQPIQQTYQPQQKPVSRIIRGAAAGYSENRFDQPIKPKTVIIPNGDDTANKTPVTPTVNREVRETSEDADMKVFTPRKPNRESPFTTGQRDNYIEPSPYERLKQPLEEYRDSLSASVPEPELEGQISAEEIEESAKRHLQRTPIPAGVVSAYKSNGSAVAAQERERADFSRVLEGIKRDDGFDRSIELVDSDGLPVSHKTKHVMDALFAPPRVSPFLRINLDDDDE